MSNLRGYAKAISLATGVTDPNVLAEIEAVMRHTIFHSTLDWQTARELQEGARQAYTVYRQMRKLPPDTQGRNKERAEWAGKALHTFRSATDSDFHDAACDLLCDLMHWCDEEGFKFDSELRRARENYAAETQPD